MSLSTDAVKDAMCQELRGTIGKTREGTIKATSIAQSADNRSLSIT